MGLRLLASSWVLLLAAVLAGGCSKQEPATGTDAAANAAPTGPSAGAPVAASPSRGPGTVASPPKAAAIPDSGDVNATLSQLTLELRRYVVSTRSVPKDFEEFAAKSRVQAPPPPPGKKYAIKAQAVILVKR